MDCFPVSVSTETVTVMTSNLIAARIHINSISMVYPNFVCQHHLSYYHTGVHWGLFTPSNIPIKSRLKV